MQTDMGTIIAPMQRAGFTKIENRMINSTKWRNLDLAMRELIVFVIARQNSSGVSPASENFISASTGMNRPHVNDLIKIAVKMKIVAWQLRGRRLQYDSQHRFLLGWYGENPAFKWSN